MDAVNRYGHAAALATGLTAFLIVLGPAFVIGQSNFLTEPPGDFASEAAAYFRMAQDIWRFPLFSIPLANEPDGANQLFTGGVPVLALVAKIIHTLTGKTVNLFGLWYLLCFALQAHAFYFLLTQIIGRQSWIAVIAVVPGLLAYAFMIRFGHVSLFASFLNIYGTALVIATTRSEVSAQRILLWLAGIACLAMFVFSYLAITSVILFGAALASLLWLRRIGVFQALAYGAAFSVGLLTLAWIGGYFWGISAERISIESYVAQALNIGSLVLPHRSVLFPTLAQDHPWDAGSFYLGVGVIVLWAIVLVTAPRAVFTPVVRHWPITLVFLLLAAYCLSNVVKFGNATLVAFDLPTFMHPIVGMLRSGGRLFWPIGYLLLAAPLAITIMCLPRLAPVAVTLVGALTIIETIPVAHWVATEAHAKRRFDVSYPGLIAAIGSHKSLRVYPSFWCAEIRQANISLVPLYQQIDFAVSFTNVSSNSAMMARKIKDCDREAREMRVFQPRELTVFMSPQAARAVLNESSRDLSESCRSLKLQQGAAVLCSAQWSQVSRLPIELKPYVPQ